MPNYFGTNGVRGKFDELTVELAAKLCKAFAFWTALKVQKTNPSLLIARDMRLTGTALTQASIAGVLSGGANAIEIGICPSPTAEWMLKHTQADGLIIVTASHNPPEWNALKFVAGNGVSVSRETGHEIEKYLEHPPVNWNEIGKHTVRTDTIDSYIAAILSRLNVPKFKKRKLRLALDPGNGTSTLVAPKLFAALGCQLTVLNSQLDGTFPGRNSEPIRDNVSDLIALMREGGFDMGVAWDGDADRVVYVDEKGEWVVGDRVFALSAMLMLQKRKGKIVNTVSTSRAVEDVAKESGVQTIYVGVGAPYISEAVLRENAVMGGEEVGGVIWSDFSLAKDGIYSAAMAAQAVCDKPLSHLLSQIPLYYNSKCKLPAKPEQKGKIISNLPKMVKAGKLDLTDGVRINFEDSWAIIRASGTENYIRVFAEAKTPREAEKLMLFYKKKVESMLRSS
jgi:phosphomannomutase/phosphoglucomutase